jgi:DNA (cytosine-5)-methyltransferase 1
MKILNLYSGIGGNRKLWENVEVTAIENNPAIAGYYMSCFPDDEVIIEDAHKYLLDHYDDGWDFIWSSPPCQTHSRMRNIAGVGNQQYRPVYPDMNLYQEIIFLNQIYHTSGAKFNGRWIVENVRGYYEPLIKPIEIGRHWFWSNFHIPPFTVESGKHMDKISELEKRKGFSLDELKGERKDIILRNCVEPELGLHILKASISIKNTLEEWI